MSDSFLDEENRRHLVSWKLALSSLLNVYETTHEFNWVVSSSMPMSQGPGREKFVLPL